VFPPDPALAAVLACYPAPCAVSRVRSLGNRGGFSGARLWRLESALGPLCLRCWPAEDRLGPRLAFIHSHMAQATARGLEFVPRLLPARDGRTAVEVGGRWWEVASWLPGQADFHARPTRGRLTAACGALALLHAAWEGERTPPAPCPAVRRRVERLARERDFLRAGWRVPLDPLAADPALPVARRAERLLPRWLDQVAAWLAPWLDVRLALQPCLADVWHDHLLFEGDRLTGLVDYGALQADHPAVDLARLLGSLVADDEPAWQAGLTAYRAVRRFGGEEELLARVLDRSGVVLALGTWLHWLYRERRVFESRSLAAARLEVLVRRVERWE
jgi:hypothetical protein